MHATAQIRNELIGGAITGFAGLEQRVAIGSIFECDGGPGGYLYFSSANCWTEWFTFTNQNHVEVPTCNRTGPASWSAIRIDSGVNIFFNLKALEVFRVDQDTGRRLAVPTAAPDFNVRWWFQPGVDARTPLETFPITYDTTPQADNPPLVGGGFVTPIGYCPRLTRFALCSSSSRLNLQAAFPGSLLVHGEKQLNGPVTGDTSFYLGQWSMLQVENVADLAPFKVVWSEQPGGNA